MATAERVAKRYKRANGLGEVLKDLVALRTLDARLESIGREYLHFKVAAKKSRVVREAEIRNQTQALSKAKAGAERAKQVEAVARGVLDVKGEDEEAKRILNSAQKMTERFEYHMATAQSVISKLQAM